MNETKNCETCTLVKIFEELEREKEKLFKQNQLREVKGPIFLTKKSLDMHLLSKN